jgi:hypothetical protein
LEPLHAILVVMFALVFIVLGFRGVNKMKRLHQSCSSRVEGHVAGFERSEHSSTNDDDEIEYTYTYYPIFSYTVSGTEYNQKSNVGTGTMRFKVNEKVTVFYRPDSPNVYFVLEDAAAKRVNYFFIGFGFLVVIILVCILCFNY